MDDFEARNRQFIRRMAEAEPLQEATRNWFCEASRYEYSYHFRWMGMPIIQFPQDMVAMQELVWDIRPDVIIETGVARGGSLVFYASLLELLGNDGQVLGIDIDIRPHNRERIESHPMCKRITMIEGSSTDPEIVAQARQFASGAGSVIVCLDSNHTHEHVLQELQLYSPLVTKGSYLIAFDTVIEDMPDEMFPDRPWSRGNNAKTAVREFLAGNQDFAVDEEIDAKLQISVAPEGYLRRVA